MPTSLKTYALLALAALSPAPAFAADLGEYYEPAPRPVVTTQTRVLPPIVRREVVEQPIIREQVIVPRVVTRRVVRPRPVVVQRRIVEQPVYVERDVIVRRPAVVEAYAAPVYRRPWIAAGFDHPWRRGWRGERYAWGGGYGGPHW